MNRDKFGEYQHTFGVICKGRSLGRLHLVSDGFMTCFIVNHFERELKEFAHLLKEKNIVQFVNRRGTIRMSAETYEQFGIKTVQYNLPELINGHPTSEVDKKTKKRLKEYGEFGLKLYYLPQRLLDWNKWFEPFENYPGEYMWKHPNTGIQACIYAAEVIHPKDLYVVGLDFYQDDYLFRRDVCNPLKVQQKKISRVHMIEHFEWVLEMHGDINWHIVTNYKNLKHGEHVRLL